MTAPGYGVQTAWLDGQRVVLRRHLRQRAHRRRRHRRDDVANPGMNATQAWQTLQQYASDGGAPGPDPAYGNGILNLGWAMARTDPACIDTAVSSNYYDATTGRCNSWCKTAAGTRSAACS